MNNNLQELHTKFREILEDFNFNVGYQTALSRCKSIGEQLVLNAVKDNIIDIIFQLTGKKLSESQRDKIIELIIKKYR